MDRVTGAGRRREGGRDIVMEEGKMAEGTGGPPRSRLAVMMGLETGGVS